MKRRIFLISILALILLGFIIVDTYGLFETNSEATKNLSVGKWVILLNDNDVTLDEDITLDDFTYETVSHVEPGYFAPGVEAYLDLVIDATGTDVALEYEIEFDDSEFVDHPNIELTITDNANNTVLNSNTITGTIGLTGSRTLSLRLTLDWVDDPLYDDIDSELIDAEAAIHMSMSFSQLLQE